jgi:hypothetical protein
VDAAQHVGRLKDKGKGTDIVVVTNTAQKDAAEADPILFDLIEVAGAETRASLVPVIRTTAAPSKKDEITGKAATALSELNCMLAEHPTPLPKEAGYPVGDGVREADWRNRFFGKLPSDTEQKVKGQAFKRAKDTLAEKGVIDILHGWVWLKQDVDDFDAVTDPEDMADLVAEPTPAGNVTDLAAWKAQMRQANMTDKEIEELAAAF